MREFRSRGSVRGAAGNGRPYREHFERPLEMSASLIGHSRSSAFRLSAAAVSMSLTGSCFFFSNRPFEVKRFQTIRRCGVDVTHGLVLLFGIGTKALPSWDSRTRWSNLCRGLYR